MKDYVLNKKPEPASNDMVWAFDLGHPLRLERCPSLAGAGAGGRRPGEGRCGNPPFNMSDWDGENLRSDVRWKFGMPPVNNANCFINLTQ
ncbi:MAG TPA: hypothetical protein VFC17_09710 [Candidatus Limnocylindrales bacterium]|nr:hypothetical protein [Candidatus Limnocylindrales bacterium]